MQPDHPTHISKVRLRLSAGCCTFSFLQPGARFQHLDLDVRASLRRNFGALVLLVELDQPILVELVEDVFSVRRNRAVFDRIAQLSIADPTEALIEQGACLLPRV